MLKNIFLYITLSSPFTWYKRVYCKTSILKIPVNVEISLVEDIHIINRKSAIENKFILWSHGISNLLIDVVDEFIDYVNDQVGFKFDHIEYNFSIYNKFRKNINTILQSLDTVSYIDENKNIHLKYISNMIKKEKKVKRDKDFDIHEHTQKLNELENIKKTMQDTLLTNLRNKKIEPYDILINAWKDNGHKNHNNLTPFDILRISQILVNLNLKFSEKNEDTIWLDQNLNDFLTQTSKFSKYKSTQKLSPAVKDWLDLLKSVRYLPISHVLYLYLQKIKNKTNKKKLPIFIDKKKDKTLIMALVMIWCSDVKTLTQIYFDLHTNGENEDNIFDNNYHKVINRKEVDNYNYTNEMAEHMIINIRKHQITVRQINMINPDMTKEEYDIKQYFLFKLISTKFSEFISMDGKFGKYFEGWYPKDMKKNKQGEIPIFDVYMGDKIKINIRTKNSIYLYNYLSSISFDYFLENTRTYDKSESYETLKDDINMLVSESLTRKKQLGLFTGGQIKALGKYIMDYVKYYEFLKSIREIKCNTTRAVKWFRRFFIKFAKKYFTEKYFVEKIEYSIKLASGNKLNVKDVAKPIRNYYRINMIDKMRLIVKNFFSYLSKLYINNYDKNIEGYISLIKIMFGPKTPINNKNILYLLMGKDPSMFIDKIYFPYINNQVRLFWDTISYYEYKKTIEEYANSIDYNFFHSYSELRKPGDNNTLIQYDIYKNTIECFFKKDVPKFDQCSSGNKLPISNYKTDSPIKFNLKIKKKLLKNLILVFFKKKPKHKQNIKKVIKIYKKNFKK